MFFADWNISGPNVSVKTLFPSLYKNIKKFSSNYEKANKTKNNKNIPLRMYIKINTFNYNQLHKITIKEPLLHSYTPLPHIVSGQANQCKGGKQENWITTSCQYVHLPCLHRISLLSIKMHEILVCDFSGVTVTRIVLLDWRRNGRVRNIIPDANIALTN